jgi:hypothetical protein
MADDSTTYGFAQPVEVNQDLTDLELRRFLQQMVVGITGLPGDKVRPRWEVEPANEPPFGVDWAAVGAVNFDPDQYPWNGQLSDTAMAEVYHEHMDVLVSFYGPNVEKYSARLVAGLKLPQNREYLTRSGFALTSVDKPIVVPVQRNNRWLHGVDVPIVLKRAVGYTYPIVNLEGGQIGLVIDVPPINRPIIVEEA